MGMYNLLKINLKCPHCGVESEMEAEFRFGFKNLDIYHLGDKLRWEGAGISTPRKQPLDGNYTDEAYVECPNCHRDFWLTVRVLHDVISSATIDLSKKGYIPALTIQNSGSNTKSKGVA